MSIKSYSYNDKTQLSKNFNISEFKCKCGRVHNTKNSTELINMLQKITDLVGADSVVISSGYRCTTHDKNVGGSGYGPHCEGYAADCQFIKNGKPINTKLLSCVAQDLGFKGIANITWDYAWIHLDMKNRIYKGNEIYNYNTLTSDFYSYYNISKSQINELTKGKTITNVTNNQPINNKDKNVTIVWDNKYNETIKELQTILSNKGYKLSIDGYMGNETYNVLKKFTIEKNDKGPLVAWVQRKLSTLYYDCGINDGICGTKTLTAIYKFQKDNNLGQGYLGGTDWVYLVGGTIKK